MGDPATHSLAEMLEIITDWFCELLTQTLHADIKNNKVLIANQELVIDMTDQLLTAYHVSDYADWFPAFRISQTTIVYINIKMTSLDFGLFMVVRHGTNGLNDHARLEILNTLRAYRLYEHMWHSVEIEEEMQVWLADHIAKIRQRTSTRNGATILPVDDNVVPDSFLTRSYFTENDCIDYADWNPLFGKVEDYVVYVNINTLSQEYGTLIKRFICDPKVLQVYTISLEEAYSDCHNA